MKYIVYVTTNKVNSKIYVGVHKTQNPEKFDGYLGCGVMVNNNGFRCETTFQKAVKKYGFKSFIRSTLAVFDNEDEAYDLETKIVTKEFIKRNDVYNMIPGGKYSDGKTTNKKVAKYSLDGDLLDVFESQSAAANSVNSCAAEIGKVASGKQKTCKGFVWRYYENVPADNICVTSLKKSKLVVQYSKVGYRMKTWKSVKDAAKTLHCDAKTITAVCKGYKNKILAGGYQWRYETDGIDVLDTI